MMTGQRRESAVGARAIVMATALLAASSSGAQTLEGVWIGTLITGDSSIHLVVGVQAGQSGALVGGLFSIDRGTMNSFDRITFGPDRAVRLEIDRLGARYEGMLSQGGDQITGEWVQNDRRHPLTLTRTTNRRFSARPWDPEVELSVTSAPMAVKADGRQRLFYEVHVTNWSDEDILLQRLEVMIGPDTAVLEGSTLKTLMLRNDTRLAAGVRTAVLISLSSSQRYPAMIRHRLTFTQPGDSKPAIVEGASTAVREGAVRISPPVRGDGWMAGNGPDSSLHHRRELRATDGRITNAQRFAFDFARRAETPRPLSPGRADNRNHATYGAEVVAVADGRIVSVKDGIPDSVPYDIATAVPLTRETVLGNCIVLDLGESRYAVYAHLQPGSLRVKAGDTVRRGQTLGLVGNSGRTDAPHLHFHITDGPDPLGSEGLPFVFDSFTHDGVTYRDEMPLAGWIVAFKL
jgi:murein DD-endopeptidase MepM/ murein hydrolase activator NlpD